jgi:penicillin-binding protein 2
VVGAAAALQDHVIDPDEPIFCPGKYKLGRRTFRCWKRSGHGSMNLRDAIKQSCDVYFYQVGLALGVDRIAEMANSFFFGQRTGIALGQEGAGLVPTKAWKQRRFRENWMKGETVVISIGQGFDLVTPLQVAVAYAAIANGGKVFRPRLVREMVDRDGVVVPGPPVEVLATVPIDAQNLARIVDALEAVVEEDGGTARRARVPGVRVAGKTGTAQVVHLKQTEELDEADIPIRYRDHAWFAGFAPADAPEIAIAVLVEHGGHGGSVAAPIFQRVAAKYFGVGGDEPAPLPGSIIEARGVDPVAEVAAAEVEIVVPGEDVDAAESPPDGAPAAETETDEADDVRD